MSDRYDKLRELFEDQSFPLVYPFKFIIKKDQDKMIHIKRIFDETAEISIRESKNGNYSSITIKQMMLSTDDIINRYKLMEEIEGIISL
ncbi:DUF493 domain-containing protein [Paracrocinitomix mangrovi]|uniref:DUF493 family protein n=1 Tax=Paracrocinitomix mangrovi TaxID=2862509 RepID=UPI001C8E145A|nr:DUF493 family protein [Paracrocinitomix mangrovi]UKN02671.1 DUF493 domain-containing protein [Paracrocinitomix mangrovi]